LLTLKSISEKSCFLSYPVLILEASGVVIWGVMMKVLATCLKNWVKKNNRPHTKNNSFFQYNVKSRTRAAAEKFLRRTQTIHKNVLCNVQRAVW